MTITIKLPNKEKVLRNSIDVKLASTGMKWSEIDLGDDRKKVGVYVIHHNNRIKYVGKTSGKKMSFGVRLRRHFQEKAAGKHTYPRLESLHTPPSIQVSLFTLKEIKKYISCSIYEPRPADLIALFESALITSLKPEFQQDNSAYNIAETV